MASRTSVFKPNQHLNFLVSPNRNAYMYCFIQDDNNHIQRVLWNRFYATRYVNAGETINIPGRMPFEVVASEFGRPETLDCFTTEQEILSALPTEIKVLDFVNLNVTLFNEIRANIERLAGAALGEGYFEIKSQ